jgi:Mitochondrial inner-membrane-bound regulator
MWIGVHKDASVCLRCQVRINHSLRRQAPDQTPCWLRRLLPITRAQSTAAAVVQDVEEDIAELQRNQSASNKNKKEHRRVWQPRVARLGVSSLGKPAEVLVLEDRDRHVHSATEDNSERSKASQSQILEALQAENLPLSSESVQQSLDQIGDAYRQESTAYSEKRQIELKKKLIDGFTLKQLRSYCHRSHRLKLSRPATLPASNDEVQTPSIRAPEPAEADRSDTAVAEIFFKLGKSSLADYIIKHAWAIEGLAEESMEQHNPITKEKLRYILSHKQSLLKEYEERFSVQIEASQKDGRINIKGKPKHVHLARGAVESLCKEITSSRARSMMTGRDLGRIVTPSFLHELARTFDVMISWASKLDKDVGTREDWLSICYHKTQDLRNALDAERAILLAERDSSPAMQERLRQSKISMWVHRFDGPSPDLTPHHAPERLNSLDRQKAWSRWAFPQKPIHKGYIDLGSEVSVAKQMLQHLTLINKQSDSITRVLKGHLNEFFEEMKEKKQAVVRGLINSGDIKEDIFAHFGKVLFPHDDTTIARAFYSMQKIKKSVMLMAKNPPSTLESTDLPALPTFLRSLPPLEETETATDGTEGQNHTRKYRIQYVPVTPQLSFGFRAPTIEIDVCRKGNPGSAVENRVTNAWAILAEQAHKVLTPDFAVDLLFGRRLKLLLKNSPVDGNAHLAQTRWLEQFEEQIRKLDSDQFPHFLNVDLPQNRFKYSSSKKHIDRDLVHQDSLNSHESTEVPADVFGGPGRPAIGTTMSITQSSTRFTEYMLKSCEVVHTTSFKAKQLCLEHLMIEDTNSDEHRVVLRLARQPLFDDDLRQLPVPILFDRAFKIAAHLSDPRLIINPTECALFAAMSHRTIS